jgi:hypothetical protein
VVEGIRRQSALWWPALISETFRALGLAPSVAQLALAKLAVGEPLDADEAGAALESTGRADLPETGFQEVTAICGRKSGKPEYLGVPLLIHRAVTDGDAPGTYLLVAPSKSDQAALGWAAIARGIERGFPKLVADIREGDGKVVLYNGNELKIQSGNWRYLRGPKYKVVAVDEACFFTSDDPEIGFANPLEYILDSVAGGMIATVNPLLMLLSTPWIRDGVVWSQYRDREATPERLVWRAATLTMNPYANKELMERHRKDRGENFYRREYLAEFSEDATAFLDPADVDAAVAPQEFFPPGRPNVRCAMALDPGRKRDHFGAAIGHREGDAVVVDWCAEWKPSIFSGLKYAEILPLIWAKAREYRVRVIASDQIDFGGIEASIPVVNGRPEFRMERVMTGGQSGAEMCDVTRALLANRKLILPNQPGLADEFKRLGDYMTAGGARDVRAKRGPDDRSRAVMLAVHQAYLEPQPREPYVEVISFPVGLAGSGPHGDRDDPFNDYGFEKPVMRVASFARQRW